jgi:hypothetical protein
MHAFEKDWRRFYPAADPVGWMMRNACAKHYARFHSLPLSKQYADTDAERQIILYRQNTLLGEVLGEGRPFWLTETSCELRPEEYEVHPRMAWPKYKFEPALRFLEEEGDPEFERTWITSASRQTWKAGAFDDLLWAIADEKAYHILWMAPSTGAVFAPYDGGVDLFLPTSDLVKELKIKHHDWLPI